MMRGAEGSMAKKILIMDDDPTIADLLTEALADEGYETYMTTQSLRFYDAVLEHQPDLVLLDLMMPYLNGKDELKLMAMGVNHQIPVIVVTAFLGAANEEQEYRQARNLCQNKTAPPEKAATGQKSLRLQALRYEDSCHFLP